MNKWLPFILFIWFFGMIFGAIFEKGSLATYQNVQMNTSNVTTLGMTTSKTFGYLFDFSGENRKTNLGTIFFKLIQPDYANTWFSVLLLDFNFLKEYNTDTGVWHETLQSYFFKLIGIIGLVVFILMFLELLRGFITT